MFLFAFEKNSNVAHFTGVAESFSRVLLSVHYEQLCLVGCLSNVLCLAFKLGCKAFVRLVDRWLPSRTVTGPCRSRYPSMPVTLFPSCPPKVTVPKSQHHLVRSSRLRNLGTAIFSNTFSKHQNTGCLQSRLRGQCRDDNVSSP